MNKEKLEIFKNAPVPKAVISNIIPSIVSMIMVLVYNLADTFFIGRTRNDAFVAAVSIATPAFMFFLAVGLLFGIGGTSLISRLLGQKKEKKAKQASAFCFWTSVSIGVVAMIIIFIFANPICGVIGATDDTLGYATDYLRIVSLGIPFLIVSNAFSNIIRAEGNAMVAMRGMIIGNLTNVVLDPIMISGFGWNVKGAAIATVIGNICSTFFYIFYLLHGKSILSISLKDYTLKDGIAKGVLAIGIPASMNSILISFSNILINNYMNKYGSLAISGLGVAMKVNMIAIMILIGLGSGIQPLLGFCYGQRNKERYMAVLKFSCILATCISFILTVVCFIGARPLVEAFLKEKESIDFGMSFARIYIYSGPVYGLLFVLINAIQSTGVAIPALILSVSRQGIVYVPVLFVINMLTDSPSLLAAAQPISDYCAVVLAVILFIVTYKKYIANFEEKNDSNKVELTSKDVLEKKACNG